MTAKGAKSAIVLIGAPDPAILPPLGSIDAPLQARLVQGETENCYGADFAVEDEKKNGEGLYKAVYQAD
jgi:hypothetical protein